MAQQYDSLGSKAYCGQRSHLAYAAFAAANRATRRMCLKYVDVVFLAGRQEWLLPNDNCLRFYLQCLQLVSICVKNRRYGWGIGDAGVCLRQLDIHAQTAQVALQRYRSSLKGGFLNTYFCAFFCNHSFIQAISPSCASMTCSASLRTSGSLPY